MEGVCEPARTLCPLTMMEAPKSDAAVQHMEGTPMVRVPAAADAAERGVSGFDVHLRLLGKGRT